MGKSNWAHSKDRRPELSTARWRALSLHIRRTEPLCRPCAAKGKPVLATQVDHIDETNPDYFDITNLQPICMECNLAKEMRRKGYTPRRRVGVDGWPVDD